MISPFMVKQFLKAIEIPDPDVRRYVEFLTKQKFGELEISCIQKPTAESICIQDGDRVLRIRTTIDGGELEGVLMVRKK